MASKDLTIKVGNFVFNHRVAGILQRHDAFLMEYNQDEDFWVFPGGRVQAGESTKAALKREWQEELGNSKIQIELLQLITENYFSYPKNPPNQKFHEVAFYYAVEEYKRDELPFETKKLFSGLEENSQRYCWIKKENISELTIYPEEIKSFLIDKLPSHPLHFIRKEL